MLKGRGDSVEEIDGAQNRQQNYFSNSNRVFPILYLKLD